MRNIFLISIVIITLLNSCEKINIPTEYPTTYNKLNVSVLTQKKTNYINRNQYIRSSLNDFGFCDYSEDPLDRETPQFIGEISESGAIEIIKYFISNLNWAEK